MTDADKKKLKTFDTLNARLSKYEAAKNCNEKMLVASDRIMWQMANIRAVASYPLRLQLKRRGWN